MFCNACGQQVSEDSAFCSRCGKPLSKDHSATTTRSAASQRTLTGQVGFIADGATRQFLRASPKVWLPLAVLLLLFVAGISFNTGTQQQGGQPARPDGKRDYGPAGSGRMKIRKSSLAAPRDRLWALSTGAPLSGSGQVIHE